MPAPTWALDLQSVRALAHKLYCSCEQLTFPLQRSHLTFNQARNHRASTDRWREVSGRCETNSRKQMKLSTTLPSVPRTYVYCLQLARVGMYSTGWNEYCNASKV